VSHDFDHGASSICLLVSERVMEENRMALFKSYVYSIMIKTPCICFGWKI
jgi:hypothetical protein